MYSTEAEAGSSKGADPQAAVEEESVEAPEPEPELPPLGPEYIPVLSLSELPKGTRKQVTVDNKEVMLFCYRKELRAIEAKSTAEAFYSEGFLNAKFTQNILRSKGKCQDVYSQQAGHLRQQLRQINTVLVSGEFRASWW